MALLAAEFRRLCPPGRDYLVLPELLQFSAQDATLLIEPTHLGALWALDSDRDGRVTLDDLAALGDLCLGRVRLYQSFEYTPQLEGYFSLQLWRALATDPAGVGAAFGDWVCRLVVESAPGAVQRLRRGGQQQYVNVDAVSLLHRLLLVQEMHGADLQAFIDLLQRAGEESGLLDLADESYDDWVPLDTLRALGTSVARGMAGLMADVWPAQDVRWADL